LTSFFALTAAVAAGCGHSDKVLEAYENAKKTGNIPAGATDAGGGTDGTGNATTGGSGPTLPQYDCNNANPTYDTAHMAPYSVSQQVIDDVNSTLQQMSADDKANQMIGIPIGTKDFYDIERSPDVTLASGQTIRGYNYRDAGRGVNLDAGQKNNRALDTFGNFSTVFPAPSIRSASWDVDLEMRVGEAIGDETAGSLNNMLLAPCMNIIRHPYWGRTQETYGEDSFHTGRMATALTVGLQKHVVACAKHFAANNIEKARSTQNAIMTEQTLREIYARHFEMVVQDGGVGCIMASYNMINNVKSTQNKHLLRDILKAPVESGGMGYQGLVISDWWAMPGDQEVPPGDRAVSDTQEAVLAGLDIEVPWTLHYSTNTLAQADPTAVEEAAKRVLTQKYRFKTARSTDGWGLQTPKTKLVGGTGPTQGSIESYQPHEDLAEEAELKSAVLLQNGLDATMPVLPLKNATKIAVVGPDQPFMLGNSTVPLSCPGGGLSCTFKFATDGALGDRGSSRVNGDPARTIGPFDGIKNAAGSTRTVVSGNSATAVGDADTVVVVVGYTPADEGEEYAILSGGDRSSLDLPAGHNDFVASVLDLNKPTVIIIESGSIVNLPWLSHTNKNQATIWAGYPGLRGGNALGKLIFAVDGANFAGKVPLAWPTQAEQDKLKFKDADLATNMGYFFGYREYDRRKAAGETVDLVYPFGHGLSYSSFTYSNLRTDCTSASAGGVVKFQLDIENTSTVDGDEVAMLFVKPPAKPATITGERPVKELKSFARINVKAGMKATADLPLRIKDLRRWEGDATTGKWVIDSGAYTILAGKNADDAEKGGIMATLMINGN
jgi:beta-glucosidase